MSMLANREETLAAIRRERENLEWISQSLSTLRKKFGDRYVAVKDRRVIDSDSEVEPLLARIRKREDSGSITIEFVSALELAWML